MGCAGDYPSNLMGLMLYLTYLVEKEKFLS